MKRLLKILSKRRYLLWVLVKNDLKMKYASSTLGFAWSLLEPLLIIGIYSLIFPTILHVDFLNWVLYFICGLIPFRFLRKGIIETTKSLVERGEIVSKLKLPLIVIPLSKSISCFINFLAESFVFFLLALMFVKPTVLLLFLPIVVVSELLTVMGIGLYFSAYYPKYRDLDYILLVVFEALFFLTPIVYRIEAIPKAYRDVYLLNPFARLIYVYQAIMLKSLPTFVETLPIISNCLTMLVVSFIIFIVGIKIFLKRQYEAVGTV